MRHRHSGTSSHSYVPVAWKWRCPFDTRLVVGDSCLQIVTPLFGGTALILVVAKCDSVAVRLYTQAKRNG